MGILIGSSCLMKCPIDRSFHSSSSPWRPASPPLVYAHRKATKKKKKLMALASLQGERIEGDSDSLRRRAVLFVGVSVLPFLQLRAVALEGVFGVLFWLSLVFIIHCDAFDLNFIKWI